MGLLGSLTSDPSLKEAQDQRLGESRARWSCHSWQCFPEAFPSVLQVCVDEPRSCWKPEGLKAGGTPRKLPVSAKLS